MAKERKEQREAKERQIKESDAEIAERERERLPEIEFERLRLQQCTGVAFQERVDSTEREDTMSRFRLNRSKLLVAAAERKGTRMLTCTSLRQLLKARIGPRINGLLI